MSKAVYKVNKSLPSNPTKEKQVLDQILRDRYGKELIERPKTFSRGLAEDIKQKVINFYNHDDISWQAPGKRDVTYVKDTVSGKKIAVQTRYLLMSVNEAKELFDKEYGPDLVHFTSFFKLRPKHVETFKKIPHNVCVCIFHCKFSFFSRRSPAIPP